MSELWLIAGLGNPGQKYERTRHNAGFWFLDALDRVEPLAMKANRKLHGEVGRQRWQGRDAIFLRPDTFMNHSGQALRAAADYFSVPAERILVAYDDLDLPPGTIRLKRGGGHGGHNGLRSIFQHLSDQGFWRLRIGIGHPGTREAVLGWVLGRARAEEERAIEEAIERSVKVLPDLLAGRGERAMTALHTQSANP
ncbi:aminoacyl-tRNA hydrolase [Wenzhouxiangella marina]|uniref:Peptidyl-tRNA hydrolase n=1 Tax=Wenzhouxiangella marina TaxID=1579979 RepID=A0A0K0XYC7_9GAMM|nr:aminoacyl-tRNA hydrolase [Wenzhouxiangella marina]AKS42675.1 Peptidyl-tRNA hydrolase [Wenzhouxiangella marina]MBB6088636.1 PTH1 family peptidyl-tRNA hydrolase [Wenzhouxiangella marina]